MAAFVSGRLLRAAAMLLFVALVMFAALPIRPLTGRASPQRGAAPEAAPEAAAEAPPPAERAFLPFLAAMLRLDCQGALGRSVYGQPVSELIAQRLPITLQVYSLAALLGIGPGLLLGALAAVRSERWIGRLAGAVALIGRSVPVIVLGPLLIVVFAVLLSWLPIVDTAGTWQRTLTDPWTVFSPAYLRLAILPAAAIGLGLAAALTRHMRGAVREALRQPSVQAARRAAAGQPALTWTVFRRQVLRDALAGVAEVFVPLLTTLVLGGFIVEPVFTIPGIGQALVNSLASGDETVLLGVMLVYSAFLVGGTAGIDVLICWLDARVRAEHGAVWCMI